MAQQGTGRRTWMRLAAASLVGSFGLVAAALPAGATGHHDLLGGRSSASLPAVRTSPRIGTPLTKFTGTTYATNEDTGDTTQTITPPLDNLTALGNTMIDGVGVTAVLQGDVIGDPLHGKMQIGISTPGNAPLQAGTLYSSSTGSSFQVVYPVTSSFYQGCNPGADPSTFATMEVDQVAYTAGVPTMLAAQFDLSCSLDGVFTEMVGTFALGILPTTPGQGYYLFGQYGELGAFGNDAYLNYLGDPTQLDLRAPMVAMATTPSHDGYWMTAGDGGVFSYGDAGFYGSTGNLTLNQPIVGMAPTPDGKGYWFVASDGGIFSYGDASFYGSMGGMPLNKPIVGMAATPDGKGYWLVASDGGIFSFGDALFYGSAGSLTLNQPIVGMSTTSDGKGYWFVAADGGIFAYGDAHFYGSTGSIHLAEPIVGMAATPDGKGYWFTASDGGVFAFGSAPYDGSLGGLGFTDIAGMAR